MFRKVNKSVLMRRSCPCPTLHFLATTNISTMSSRSPFQGSGRSRGRGRGRLSYSDTPHHPNERTQFVSGDSHFQSVRDSNQGFRNTLNQNEFQPRSNRPQHFNHGQHYNRCPPPPLYNQQHGDPRPPPQRYGDQQFVPRANVNQEYRSPAPFYPNKHFGNVRPRMPQQVRPRPPKDLVFRNWEYAKNPPQPDSEKFIIISYNILADYLAKDHRNKLYYHVPRHMMDWEWRKRSLIFELKLWSADILCLQEVDRFQDLEEELRHLGYSGIWKMRTGNPIDGCATFWKTSRFKLRHEECIEFNKLGLRDNVAQICVLESLCENDAEDTEALLKSSCGGNKVVVCNTHVLYNPRRGEIKIGQVRELLNRAGAVSKVWDEAPVVVCGDFNCTPKSALYNFISEQKLDISQVDRDKVSGQASAEIRAYRPGNSRLRADSVLSPTENPPTAGGKDINLTFNESKSLEKQNNSNGSAGSNDKETMTDAQHAHTPLHVASISCTGGQDNKEDVVIQFDTAKDPQLNKLEDTDKTVCLATNVQVDNSYEISGCDDNVGGIPVAEMDEKVTLSGALHPNESYCGVEAGHIENVNISSSLDHGVTYEERASVIGAKSNSLDRDNSKASSADIESSSDSRLNLESTDPTNTDVSPVEPVLNKKLDDLSLNESVEATRDGEDLGEDESTTLYALRDHEDPLASEFAEVSGTDIVEFQLHSASGEILEDFETANDNAPYDPSVWTPVEIETATRCPEGRVVEHPLKLRSTYTEVEDCSGRRDSNGEPLATSYNRCFLGTVDYIWRSEGLQTIRVLAPIPKQAMQWTAGFPTRKWGSDHVALASELAFSKDVTDQKTEGQ